MTERTTMKATWQGATLAESDDTVVVEGNHGFPAASLNPACFSPSEYTTVCGWKGTATYRHVMVDGKLNANAAWTYATPKPAAAEIAGRWAFWKGVTVREA